MRSTTPRKRPNSMLKNTPGKAQPRSGARRQTRSWDFCLRAVRLQRRKFGGHFQNVDVSTRAVPFTSAVHELYRRWWSKPVKKVERRTRPLGKDRHVASTKEEDESGKSTKM
jgi:hypothetical protein